MSEAAGWDHVGAAGMGAVYRDPRAGGTGCSPPFHHSQGPGGGASHTLPQSLWCDIRVAVPAEPGGRLPPLDSVFPSQELKTQVMCCLVMGHRVPT